MAYKKTKPTIGITLGDPSGIGPEIILKSLRKPSIKSLADFIIIGDTIILEQYNKGTRVPHTIIDVGYIKNTKEAKVGKATKKGAEASIKYLDKAVELLKKNHIQGLVTAPICKETITQKYPTFQGHTEFLANAFKIKNVGMMFVTPTIKTILVTRHMPLAKVCRTLNQKMIWETIELTNQELKTKFKIKKPRIAVCGLNPHAGEGGTIGKEEIKTIIPAIQKAQKQKLDVRGPFAADTLFSSKLSGDYDTIIAMYHDQGLIPVKTIGIEKLVNLTIGLPFVRTSPAHGTAFNIAGKNIADESSMCSSIKLTKQLIS